MSLTQHVCRFCGSTCQDDSDGCAALPSVATGAACPTLTLTTSPTTPGGTSAVNVTAADSAGVDTEPSSGGLDAGAIVGIVVGALCVILLLAALVAFVARRRGQAEETPSAETVALDYLGESKNAKSEYAAFTAVPDSAAAAIQYGSASLVGPSDVVYDATLPPATDNYGAAPTFE
jgi:hypothetical protein